MISGLLNVKHADICMDAIGRSRTLPWNLFPVAKSQNRRQEYRITQKSQNARFWQRQTWLVSDHG